jgi:hypothetical protein
LAQVLNENRPVSHPSALFCLLIVEPKLSRDHHFIARFQIVDQVEVLRRDPAEPKLVPVAPA